MLKQEARNFQRQLAGQTSHLLEYETYLKDSGNNGIDSNKNDSYDRDDNITSNSYSKNSKHSSRNDNTCNHFNYNNNASKNVHRNNIHT